MLKRNFKKTITVLSVFFALTSFSGCNKTLKVENTTVGSSVKNVAAAENIKYDLATLNIKLQENWKINHDNKDEYQIIDNKGEARGLIMYREYKADYDFKANDKPNHSTIINEEAIETPIGQCKLYTLDADNGTAASGVTGTHNDYYAVLTVKDKIVYIFSFLTKDKDLKNKEQFIDILKNVSIGK